MEIVWVGPTLLLHRPKHSGSVGRDELTSTGKVVEFVELSTTAEHFTISKDRAR